VPVRERALLFGEGKGLVGIVSDADGGNASPTGVLLLNAGVLHRVGPNRVHVRLARALADGGLVAMRFDFSGLGDSRPARDALPFAERARQEIQAATEALGALRGCRRFLLMGICSGADAALRAAARDERVVGAALIEAYAERRPGFLAYSYRRKLLSPRAWLRLLAGRSELWSSLRRPSAAAPGGAPDPGPPAEAPSDSSLLPSPAEMRDEIRGLLGRGAHICFVYSADSPAYFNYRTLLGRELRPALRSGRARLEVLRGTDHVFTPLAVQDRLVEALVAWAREAASEVA
jgi:hypothetical protein